MGLDPNTICNPINDEMACKANTCCRWLGLPAILVNNATQSTTETNQEQESKGPKLIIPELQIKLPGLVFSDQNKIQTTTDGDQTFFYIPWIGEYIQWLYNYSIGIISLLALLAIMIGGFYWIMAGGSASRVSEAKSWISAAISGLALALTSYLLLFTINSNLVRLPSIKISAIKKVELQYNIRNDNISEMNKILGPGDYCGCILVEDLTYEASGFNEAKIENLLRTTNVNSPYIAYSGLVDNLCRSFNIDPVYVIAQWRAESSLGTKGAAKKHNNPGNFTCNKASNKPTSNSANGYTVSYTCVKGSDGHYWRHYKNLNDGLIGYFINKKTNNYFSGYIRPNIYRYAPPSDHNDTNGYISNIVKFVNKYSNNKHPEDKYTDINTCSCYN
jgi:hypothetical protein